VPVILPGETMKRIFSIALPMAAIGGVWYFFFRRGGAAPHAEASREGSDDAFVSSTAGTDGVGIRDIGVVSDVVAADADGIGADVIAADAHGEHREEALRRGLVRVMITCPETGEPVFTGIDMEKETFEFSEFTGHTVSPCPACGKAHPWDKEDAFLKAD
jgi:hypothetical protein